MPEDHEVDGQDAEEELAIDGIPTPTSRGGAGDANHATIDGSLVLQLVMDTNWEVEGSFKCDSGVTKALPLLVIGLAALGFISLRVWRRG
jgi:hypothetical protein